MKCFLIILLCFVTLSVDAAVTMCLKKPVSADKCTVVSADEYAVEWSATCGDTLVRGVSFCAGADESGQIKLVNNGQKKQAGDNNNVCWCRIYWPKVFAWVRGNNPVSFADTCGLIATATADQTAEQVKEECLSFVGNTSSIYGANDYCSMNNSSSLRSLCSVYGNGAQQCYDNSLCFDNETCQKKCASICANKAASLFVD